jgi:hypothetical protein
MQTGQSDRHIPSCACQNTRNHVFVPVNDRDRTLISRLAYTDDIKNKEMSESQKRGMRVRLRTAFKGDGASWSMYDLVLSEEKLEVDGVFAGKGKPLYHTVAALKMLVLVTLCLCCQGDWVKIFSRGRTCLKC